MQFLTEDKRQSLINKSKTSEKGKKRFDRRNKSRVANTVKSFNSIDMNKLFKEDILTVNIPVNGETDDYIVRITFGGFLELLQDQLDPERELNFRDVARAAIIGFNRDDVFIHCSCPDFKYRFNYYATRNNINSGVPETRPSKITNPNDSLGSACKHVLLILNNTSWIIRVARVIVNYIKYMQSHYEKLYADIIYPAIYGEEYIEPVQLTIDDMEDDNSLASDDDTETLDDANDYNKKRTQFKTNNNQGVRFTSSKSENDADQLSMDDLNPDDQL
jgi:hypothetical protein